MLVLERITGEDFKRTPSLDKRFCRHFQQEIEDALSASQQYNADILDALRQSTKSGTEHEASAEPSAKPKPSKRLA